MQTGNINTSTRRNSERGCRRGPGIPPPLGMVRISRGTASAPAIVYTQVTPDPNITVKACATPCVRNGLKAKTLKCKAFGAVVELKRFCTPPSVLKIKFSAPAFTIKLRERGTNLTNVKSNLSTGVNT